MPRCGYGVNTSWYETDMDKFGLNVNKSLINFWLYITTVMSAYLLLLKAFITFHFVFVSYEYTNIIKLDVWIPVHKYFKKGIICISIFII